MPLFRRSVVLALVIATTGCGVASAAAPALFCALATSGMNVPDLHADSDAPPGASASWLPDSQWVMERWVPFDESRLYKVLDTNEAQVNNWLYLGRSLRSLAVAHGVPLSGLGGRIVGPRPAGMPTAHWRLLKARARTVLSQPHLSQHLLFHLFHTVAITRQFPTILGVSNPEFVDLYQTQHLSFEQVATLGHRTEGEVHVAVLRIDRSEGSLGVKLGDMSAQENQVLRARDEHRFQNWWDYNVPR